MPDSRPPRHPELVSVVVPCLNAAGTLAEQLRALAAQTYVGKWQVVIVDNGSTDSSIRLAESFRPSLPDLVIAHETQRGVASVRNAAVRVASGELLAFTDADDVVVPGWLGSLVSAAAEADLVAGRLEDRQINAPSLVARRGGLPSDQPMVTLGYKAFAPGGNCAVWRDVIEAVGGWDPTFQAGSDDVDFSWRCMRVGFTLGYADGAVVHYRYRPGIRGLCRQYFRFGLTEAQLLRCFRDDIGQPWTLRNVLGTWRRLLVEGGPRLVRGGDAGVYELRRLCYHLGHLLGSLRFRVLLP